MLEIKDMVVAYGRVNAVKGITFSVEKGQIVTLLGTNGAGKSTTLRAISGLLKLVSGSITFEGEKLDGLPAHKVVERGIAQSPEGRRLFRKMSVEDNLKLGAYTRKDVSGVRADMQKVYDLFPVLGERRHQPSGLFSGGEQQMLAIGRAIMKTIRELQSDGVTILLVEQNASAALSLADRGYVLEVGQIMFSDTGKALLGDDRVRKAYLGAS